jgi:hypothetical protein
MIRLVFAVFATLALGACSSVRKEPPRQIPLAKAAVLPLELSDDYSFRKVSTFFYDTRDASFQRPTTNSMLQFERQRTAFGAVSGYDRAERFGNYFTVWWRSEQPADIKVRLEYRQQNLGSYVQAKELFYPGAKGTKVSKFTVIGDEYGDEGKVTAWRLLLIRNNRIVGLRQSFLWN